MKTFILILTAALNLGLISGTAMAQSPTAPHEFNCASPDQMGGFNGLFDPSGYQIGSGYGEMKDASYRDGYSSADLICKIADLGSWGCVGYTYNVPETSGIVEVQVKINSATHTVTVTHGGVHARSWTCAQ
jgi:hypothetical protein